VAFDLTSIKHIASSPSARDPPDSSTGKWVNRLAAINQKKDHHPLDDGPQKNGLWPLLAMLCTHSPRPIDGGNRETLNRPSV
jgi:hypothetical protein